MGAVESVPRVAAVVAALEAPLHWITLRRVIGGRPLVAGDAVNWVGELNDHILLVEVNPTVATSAIQLSGLAHSRGWCGKSIVREYIPLGAGVSVKKLVYTFMSRRVAAGVCGHETLELRPTTSVQSQLCDLHAVSRFPVS